jgi:hypothetical protein
MTPNFMSAIFRALQMFVQDGAHGAIVAPHNRRLLRQQPLQPAAVTAVTITAAMAMLLVAAVMCLRWRKRTRQQQQSHAQQQQQHECNDAQLKVPHVVTPQACYGYSSSNSSSQSQQQKQQHVQLQATQPGLAAAAQQLIKQLLPLGDQRRCSSSRVFGSSSTTADSSVTVAAAAGSTTAASDVYLSVLPLGSDAYCNSTAAGHSHSIQHGMSCRGSNSSISSSGRSDSASSIDAATVASQSNPDSIAVDAASSAAVSSVAANSSSTDSLGPLTTLLTEANLLRCVTPDNASSSRYNSHTIHELESQPASHAAAGLGMADAGGVSPGSLPQHLHTSASSSTAGNEQPLRVNAALPGLQTCDGDARGLPAVLMGTLTRTQAAAIKFGELHSMCPVDVWICLLLMKFWF